MRLVVPNFVLELARALEDFARQLPALPFDGPSLVRLLQVFDRCRNEEVEPGQIRIQVLDLGWVAFTTFAPALDHVVERVSVRPQVFLEDQNLPYRSFVIATL